MKKTIWVLAVAIVTAVLMAALCRGTPHSKLAGHAIDVYEFDGDFGTNYVAAMNYAFITGQISRFTDIDGAIVYCYGRINGVAVECYGAGE